MTEIYFYSNAADKLRVACRLCEKALSQNARIIVYALNQTTLEKLDKLLWTFQQTSFLPHCFMHDDTALVKSTPIVLSGSVVLENGCTILLNLHEQCPPDFAQFKRVIEVAGQSYADKISARKRYRFYQQAGYVLHHHQLQQH
ncbi:DNA polymerase III, chi subunit [Nitrosomonas sp. Nm51]|uniref:DNA polymerase III subunit chi n=1 Tax=Nitrosomonas sp. Nm51 TaxID=133720 RepID=UPI0008B596A8|nr:DNA polymerase III subunit chi [Nitrosomonas sp. Nm51]SER31947.1 DNA polymerase III, chi subunit [Nitrosomonas sp. Nm51]